jgi:hypothetical protein
MTSLHTFSSSSSSDKLRLACGLACGAHRRQNSGTKRPWLRCVEAHLLMLVLLQLLLLQLLLLLLRLLTPILLLFV